MAAGRDQIITWVEEIGVMSRADLERLCADHSLREDDGDALLKLLAAQGGLTRFQANALHHGLMQALSVGDYLVLDKLGSGGMGDVYKARHRRLNRVVAIKLLPAAATRQAQMVRRFHREVEAAGRLVHPNIVTAHDAGEHLGVHYLVMEYIQGQDLSARIKTSGPLPLRQAVDCILQAARGLSYAHEHGVIHRDIKPSNLILSQDGVVKVLDLGLVRFEQDLAHDEPSLTGDGTVGTPDYMAPEQALSTRETDHRSDIYALGCTLYRVATAKPAFAGSTVMQKLIAQREAPPPSLAAAVPHCPAELERVFQTMLAKDPSQRQASMAQVVSELEACLTLIDGGEQGGAEAVTSIAPGRNAAANLKARRRWLPAAIAALALMITAGAIWRWGAEGAGRGAQADAAPASMGAGHPLERSTDGEMPASQPPPASHPDRMMQLPPELAPPQIKGPLQQPIAVLRPDPSSPVERIACSREGDLLVALHGESRPVVRLWRTSEGTQLHQWPARTSGIAALGLAGNGQVVGIAEADAPRVRLIDTASGQQRQIVTVPGIQKITAMGLWLASGGAPLQGTLAVAGDRNTVVVSDLSSGEALARQGAVWSPQDLAFLPHGRQFVVTGLAAGRGGCAQVWDSRTAQPGLQINQQRGMGRLSLSASGVKFITASGQYANVVDLLTQAIAPRFDASDGGFLLDAALHPSGWFAATVSPDQTIRLWDLRPQTPLEVARITCPTGVVARTAGFLGDGRRLAVGWGWTVLIFDVSALVSGAAEEATIGVR